MNLVPYQVVLWEINTPPIPAKSPQNKTEKCISYLDTAVVKWKLPYCTTISCRTAKKQMWVNRALSSCLCWWPASLLPKPECYKFVSSGEIIQHLICSHRNPPSPTPPLPPPHLFLHLSPQSWHHMRGKRVARQPAMVREREPGAHESSAWQSSREEGRCHCKKLFNQAALPARPRWTFSSNPHLAPAPLSTSTNRASPPRTRRAARRRRRENKRENRQKWEEGRERERETILYNNLSLSATPASLLTESKHEEEAELSMHGDSHD